MKYIKVQKQLMVFKYLLDEYRVMLVYPLREKVDCMENYLNKNQLFYLDYSSVSADLLSSKYFEHRNNIDEELLASLFSEIKQYSYKYQFIRCRYYNSLVSYYYHRYVLNALESRDQDISQEANRFTKNRVIDILFCGQSKLSRNFLL